MGCSYRRYYSVVRTIVTICRFIGGNRISFFSTINFVETKKKKKPRKLAGKNNAEENDGNVPECSLFFKWKNDSSV